MFLSVVGACGGAGRAVSGVDAERRRCSCSSPTADSTAPSIPDLLIAAAAEKAGLTVLAADKDFTLIAAVTDQPIDTWLTVAN